MDDEIVVRLTPRQARLIASIFGYDPSEWGYRTYPIEDLTEQDEEDLTRFVDYLRRETRDFAADEMQRFAERMRAATDLLR